jgi:4-hydroxy-3-methylbut-2-enyl diphosphate reductase
VVGNPEEAESTAGELARIEPGVKTVLIGQTTISSEEYRVIGDTIKKFFPGLEIINTICSATADRQQALRKLCDAVDAVIIAGGRDSANTRRLFSLAGELGKPAWIAESPAELPPGMAAYRTVGLCAGASTPDDLIDKIEEALKAL